MSELIRKIDCRATIRWKLLAGTSALALTTYIAATTIAAAEDTDRPTVWIELGGQLSRLKNGLETFVPPLMDGRPSIFEQSQKFEKPPSYSLEEAGVISIQPNNSNWIFSASVRYGRSKSSKHVLQQTNPEPYEKYLFGKPYIAYPIAQKFAETTARNSEQHVVLDFQAGKDVGLGLFGGRDASSVVSAGVRFAQFGSRSNISLKSDPDWHFLYIYQPFLHVYITNGQPFHSNLASLTAERSFHGIGPSVSWKSSTALLGNIQDGELMIDWGLNAAVLFGRQRTQTHHQSTARYHEAHGRVAGQTAIPQTISQFPATPDHARSQGVTVPNVGGFAGLSFKYPNAKLSFGYRADFFFGAMDGGIDASRSENLGFHGPFATVSIGLGG